PAVLGTHQASTAARHAKGAQVRCPSRGLHYTVMPRRNLRTASVGTQHARTSIDVAAHYLRIRDRRGGRVPGQADQAHRAASRRQRHRHGRTHPRRRARQGARPADRHRQPTGRRADHRSRPDREAEPDGYTISRGRAGPLAIPRHMVAKLPYDIERDFQPIALATRGHLLLAVSPTLPFKSVQEVIDYAKANPGKLLNASSSNGSPGHV